MTNKVNNFQMNTVGLWASAFVLGGLILTQAGRIQSAQADSVVANNGFCMSTITCGNQSGPETYDLLWLIDDRSETLMIFYGDVYNKVLDVRTIKNLSDIFKQARIK
jgi:hypothetical protein